VPTQYFNILVLPKNKDKYCYLQFARKGSGHVPSVTTHLNVFRWSIVNSNFDSEHRVLCPKNYLNLHENLLEIYLKLLVSNYWGGGEDVPKTASMQTGEIKMCSSVELGEGNY
jgi:hypothetical protein